MITAFLCLAFSFLDELPFPLNELGLNEKQAKAVSLLVERHKAKSEQLEKQRARAKGKAKDKLGSDIEQSLVKRNDEIKKILDDKQKENFDTFMSRGVPIGDGFFRSGFLLVKRYSRGRSGGSRPITAPIIVGASKEWTVTTVITNHTGKTAESIAFSVILYDDKNVEVGRDTVIFDDVPNQQSIKLESNITADTGGKTPRCVIKVTP